MSNHGYDFRKMTIEDVHRAGLRIKGESPLHKISANGRTPLSEAAAVAIDAATIFATKPTTAKKPTKPRRKGKLLSIAIFLPIRIHSEANERAHWSTKSARHAKQKQELKVEWYRLTRNAVVPFPCVVKFTRIGQKAFDSDAVVIGCKWVRDAICECLGVDDGDTERIRFEYGQEVTGKREYGVRVEVVTL